MKIAAFLFATFSLCAGVAALAVWGIATIAGKSSSDQAGSSGAPARIQAFAAETREIVWHRDYASALAEAKSTGKPLFIEFRCVP